MVVRYHWGHGVGHLYTHQDSELVPSSSIDTDEGLGSNLLVGERDIHQDGTTDTDVCVDDTIGEIPSESADEQGSDGASYSEGDCDDEELFAFEEMYGNTENDGNID
jgi:hypothetical protein